MAMGRYVFVRGFPIEDLNQQCNNGRQRFILFANVRPWTLKFYLNPNGGNKSLEMYHGNFQLGANPKC